MQPTVHVIGNSCRSIAESLTRAGCRVVAFDDFLDRDLTCIATCDPTPISLPAIERWVATRPTQSASRPLVMLAGGMENRVDLLRAIETRYQILGPSSHVISSLRNPTIVQRLAEQAGVSFPVIYACPASRSQDPQTHYVWKPLRSGGGKSIVRVGDEFRTTRDGHYCQALVEGSPMGATWCLDSQSSKLLATCTALTQADWDGPTEFAYRGSVFRSLLDEEHLRSLVRLGEIVRSEFGYWGLLQADFVLSASNQLHLLEFNPRWAASFEVIERSLQINLAFLHLAACDFAIVPMDLLKNNGISSSLRADSENTIYAKAIYYATDDTTIDRNLSNWLFEHRQQANHSCDQRCWIADIPRPDSVFRRGQPIVSLIAKSTQPSVVIDELRKVKELVTRKLAG